MTTPRFQPRNGVLIGAAALLTACTPPGGLRNFDGDPWVKRNAEALDRMAARLNEYGTVGMSAPLIMTPDPNFEFSVKKGPEEYFNDAKTEIQARAAAVEQEVSLFGLNASASIDPTQMAKYGEALKTYQDERIDYLRQRTERDRALNAATAASNAAARLRRDAMLKAAEQIEDPQQRAEAQAKALDDYAKALTANAGNAPTAPTYPTPDKPTAQGAQGEASRGATQAQAVIPDKYKKFIEPGNLLGAQPSVTSANRSALIMAAGDTAVEGILRALHSSQDTAALLGKRKLFAAAMVSVTPGWRTRADFAARLTIKPQLRYEPARSEIARHVLDELKKSAPPVLNCGQLKAPAADTVKYQIFVGYSREPSGESNYPRPAAVSAVSPMTDTQHLQLANSQRQRKERALQLAIALQSAGLDAGAKLFYEHLQDLEKDILTDNREVPVTAYATGYQFGYEIGPELWSQTDPTASKPKPGYRLVRQSFPTLILLGFDDEQLKPRLKCDAEKPDAAPTVVEPQLYFQQTRRWIPLTEKAAATGPIDGEIAALNDEITRAYFAPADCGEAQSCIKPNVREQITARGNALAEELLGNFQQQYLPLCMVVPDLQACKDAARKEAEANRQQAAQPAAAQPLSAMPQPTQAGATRAANAKPTRTK